MKQPPLPEPLAQQHTLLPLYRVPRRSYIQVEMEPGVKVRLFFDHLDGMYSLCKDANNNPVHLAGWTEVEVLSEAS